jgi:hypothetical protein
MGKAMFMEHEHGQSLVIMRSIKQVLDPTGILNPGVKIALPRQRALGAIKYDPDLPSLPAKAKEALARVERDRAYAEFRLALLDDA